MHDAQVAKDPESVHRSNIKSKNVPSISPAQLNDADIVLAQLVQSVPVDLMPGATDPSNHVVPQQVQP